jgi:Fur family transcriptional regulator, zinc uptake regulator
MVGRPDARAHHDSTLDTAHAPAAAASLCRERGAQFTEVRRRVLEALWQAGQPLTAYELMPRLEAALERRLAPPTIYRSLDFLMDQRLVSRIESRNAFVPCAHPEHPHICVFFVCDRCSTSVEVENTAIEHLLADDAASLGFEIHRRVVELQGLCAQCVVSA